MTGRRPIAALVSALLIAAVPTPALAQDATVEIVDPATLAQAAPSLDSVAPLTQEPQTDDPAPEPDPEPAPEPEPEPAPRDDLEPDVRDAPRESSQAELAETGADARVVLGIGLAMLLCGVGLRLRTIPERF